MIYKYHGKARKVIEALLDKFQDSNIDIPDLENTDTLNVTDLSNKFGGDVEVILDDFKSKQNFNRAIQDITRSLYSNN